MTVRGLAMVLVLFSAGALGWSPSAHGQVADRIPAERARIEGERQQKTSAFDAEESACLTRFAVNDCQNQVGVRRRQMLSDLKRQEASLNAVERQQKGDEQLQRGQAKAVENVQREQDAQSTTGKMGLQDRQQAQDEKQRAHQQAKSVAIPAPAPKSGSTLDAKTVDENRKAYQEKQNALEKRRQERDQRVLEHGTSGPPLPLHP